MCILAELVGKTQMMEDRKGLKDGCDCGRDG